MNFTHWFSGSSSRCPKTYAVAKRWRVCKTDKTNLESVPTKKTGFNLDKTTCSCHEKKCTGHAQTRTSAGNGNGTHRSRSWPILTTLQKYTPFVYVLHPFIHTIPTYCRVWTHPALCDFNDDDSLRRTPCDDCEDEVIVYKRQYNANRSLWRRWRFVMTSFVLT